MMQRLVSQRVPFLPITVALGRPSTPFEALLDTGLEGDPIVPETPTRGPIGIRGCLAFGMAEGSEILRPIDDGTAIVGPLGAFPVVVVPLGDECPIGVRFASGFLVTPDHGRQPVVDPQAVSPSPPRAKFRPNGHGLNPRLPAHAGRRSGMGTAPARFSGSRSAPVTIVILAPQVRPAVAHASPAPRFRTVGRPRPAR